MITRLPHNDSIERYLLNELDATLTEQERDIESAMAILGEPSSRDLIEVVLDEEHLRRPLHDLSERYLLTVTEQERQQLYSQHAILQTFYYENLNQRQRRKMHRRAAEFYVEEEPDILKAAQHYLKAGDKVDAAQLATQNVTDFINRGQAHELRQLLESLKTHGFDAAQQSVIEIALGNVYTHLGQGKLAHASYHTALRYLDTLPNSTEIQLRRASIYRGFGELLQYDTPQDALQWLQQGLEMLKGINPSSGDGAACSEHSEIARIHILLGSVQITLGEYDKAIASVQHGLELLPNVPSHVHAHALMNLGTIYSERGDIEQGKAHTQRALEISTQLHDNFLKLKLLQNLGIDKEIAGDWVGALADYQAALTLAEDLSSIAIQANIRNSLGTLYTQQGNHQLAETYLHESLSLARRHALTEHLAYVLAGLANLYTERGRWPKVTTVLAEAEQLARSTAINHLMPILHSLSAQMHLADRKLEIAQEYAQHAIQFARELGMEREIGIGLRILGQVSVANKELAQAQSSFEESLMLLVNLDPYEAARTQVAWGTMLIANGDTDAGTQHLYQAQQIFNRLGAQHDLAHIPQSNSN